MASPTKLLVIDDEPAIRRLLRTSLTAHDYAVTEAASGAEGLLRVQETTPDLVLLDLGLPDVDGLDLIPAIRAVSAAPIVVLSVRSHDDAKIRALDLGASDYVTKPFSVPELMARLRAAARHRLTEAGQEPVFQVDMLRVDLVRRLVSLRDVPVHLTPREYDCLSLFVKHAGKVLTHSYVLREIWGNEHADNIEYLRSYIRMLRQKIEPEPGRPRILLTEPGVGYRLTGPDWVRAS